MGVVGSTVTWGTRLTQGRQTTRRPACRGRKAASDAAGSAGYPDDPAAEERPMAKRTSLFLASSSELKAERGAFEARINRKNKLWHDAGIFLHLDVWEDYVDAMSRTRLQDEYNEAIRAADIFVLLVHTKVGKYSAEEFETAHAQCKATGKPLIYTYFKNPPGPDDADPGPEYGTVRALQAKLAGLGHFITPYASVDGLIDHFTQQLDKLQAKGAIQGDAATSASVAQPASRATNTGSGAIAQGPGAQAAGAGGVVIGGNNSGSINTGTQTHVHTGGGAYVRGNVSVQGGDFVGRDKVLHGSAPADMAAAFGALLAAIDKQAEPAAKEMVAEQMEAIEVEAAKAPAQRDDKRMARLLDGLLDLVPGAVSAVVGAFASPLLAGIAGPATAAVLDRFKKP
jgi:hypothetical protein